MRLSNEKISIKKTKPKFLIGTIIVLVAIIGLMLLFPRTRDRIIYKIDFVINSPSKEDVLQKMYKKTPVKSSIFYESIRDYVDCADRLFLDSILPNFVDCDYFEIKEIKSILANTPASDSINTLFTNIRESLLAEIHENLTDYAESQKALFVDTIIPLVLIDVDTTFAGEFENVINDYIGFLAKIFDNIDDLEKAWNKNIHSSKYDSIVNKTLEGYNNSVLEFYIDYYEDLQISQYRLDDLPKFGKLDLSFPKDSVEKYIDSEIQENITITIDAGIDIILYICNGNIIKIIRKIKDFKDYTEIAYEIYNTIQGDNISNEEILMLGISEIVNLKITDILKTRYCQYFDRQTELMFDQIKEKL